MFFSSVETIFSLELSEISVSFAKLQLVNNVNVVIAKQHIIKFLKKITPFTLIIFLVYTTKLTMSKQKKPTSYILIS